MAGMVIGPDPKNINSSVILWCKNALSSLKSNYDFIKDYDIYFIKYNKKLFLEIKLLVNESFYIAHILSTGITIEDIIKTNVIIKRACPDINSLKIIINY